MLSVDAGRRTGRAVAGADGEPTVLLVDDEQSLLELYERALAESWTVRTATAAERALQLVDGSVDVVVADRRMPGTSGDELVRRLRDRGHDVPAGMLSAMAPEADILELPVDDYRVKPVSPDDLREAVELLSARDGFCRDCRELFALVSKRSALEAGPGRPDPAVLDDLVERIETVRKRLSIDDPTVAETSRPEELPSGVHDACSPPERTT